MTEETPFLERRPGDYFFPERTVSTDYHFPILSKNIENSQSFDFF